MKHNKRWFYNRIGKRILCNDHEPEKIPECSGIICEDKDQCDKVMTNQERGIEFRD